MPDFTFPNTSVDNPEQRVEAYLARHRRDPGGRHRATGPCPDCSGMGLRASTQRRCPMCEGTGEVPIPARTDPNHVGGRHRSDRPAQ